jgi:hypothetical protein
MDPPRTAEEVKKACVEQGRGYPRCQDNNVLVHVTVVRGWTKMEAVAESVPLSQFFTASGISMPKVGTATINRRTIETFLVAVSDFYKASSAASKPCRFDYRLTYVTKEDYYDGRERFEKYFCAAGINRVGIGSK